MYSQIIREWMILQAGSYSWNWTHLVWALKSMWTKPISFQKCLLFALVPSSHFLVKHKSTACYVNVMVTTRVICSGRVYSLLYWPDYVFLAQEILQSVDQTIKDHEKQKVCRFCMACLA